MKALLWCSLLCAGLNLLQADPFQWWIPKYGCVSALGCLFGTGWLDHSTFVLASFVYALAALTWASGRLTPWSGWLSVLSFVVAASALWENLSYVLHKYVLSYLLLSALALVQHLGRRLEPLWAERLLWGCVAQYYGFSGLSKLLQSGLAWADGLSMQIWVQFMGKTETQLAHYLLGAQSLAKVAQAAALGLELSAWLLPFVPGWRRPWTVLVCVFHLTVLYVLGISFLSNIPPLFCLAFWRSSRETTGGADSRDTSLQRESKKRAVVT